LVEVWAEFKRTIIAPVFGKFKTIQKLEGFVVFDVSYLWKRREISYEPGTGLAAAPLQTP
jgi:hypothetical protein